MFPLIAAGNLSGAGGIRDCQLRAVHHADRAAVFRGFFQVPVQLKSLQVNGDFLVFRNHQRHVVGFRRRVLADGHGAAVWSVVYVFLNASPRCLPDGGGDHIAVNRDFRIRRVHILGVSVDHPAQEGPALGMRKTACGQHQRHRVRRDRVHFPRRIGISGFKGDGAWPQHRFLIPQPDPVDRIVAGEVGLVAVARLVQVAGQDDGGIDCRSNSGTHADLRGLFQPAADVDPLRRFGKKDVGCSLVRRLCIILDDRFRLHKKRGTFLHTDTAAFGARVVFFDGCLAGAADGTAVIDTATRCQKRLVSGDCAVFKSQGAAVQDTGTLGSHGCIVLDDAFAGDFRFSLVADPGAAITAGRVFGDLALSLNVQLAF